MNFRIAVLLVVAVVLLSVTPTCLAQFNGSITGTVQDLSGAVIPQARVTLTNTATQISSITTSDEHGAYRFISLGPAVYQLSAGAAGFSTSNISVTLDARQTQNVPLVLIVGGVNSTVQVDSQAPLLDTAETRNELTLPSVALSQLPVPGHNAISLVTYAPGVVGIGAIGNQTTGSAGDNFAPESQVAASANGRSSVGNLYVVDDLDVTSGIRPGVLNVVPNADTIQEATVQVNTYDVDYGRSSSMEVILSTKPGTDKFHGRISDYFTNQHLSAGTEFVKTLKPYHSNDISGSFGGPLIPHHQAFFYFAYQTLRSTTTTGNSSTTYEDPAFVAFAKANYPNSLGTSFLTKYGPTLATTTGVSKTAAQVFPTTCGTPATDNLPCSTPVLDSGVFNATNARNGSQYYGRLDQYFKHDRIYGSVYFTPLSTSTANIRPAFSTTSAYNSTAIQVNETHTFTSNLLNQAAFGYVRIEGNAPQTGMFSIPVATITGQAAGFGASAANTNYIQDNFRWRDVVLRSWRNHSFKFGYEGWMGEDIARFQGVYSQPTFAYTNLINFVSDNPYTETGFSYNPFTGQPQLANYGYQSTTSGAFFEDSWKAGHHITFNYGLRWDNFGNPAPQAGTPFANFHFGAGSTPQQQVANGGMVQTPYFFDHAISDVWSPRAAVAWDPTGKGKLTIKGGFGLFRDWPTLGVTAQRLSSNPPDYVVPVFYSGTATPPVLTTGTSNTFPFGFTYPTLPPYTVDAHGGITGLQITVGGIDPAIKSPISYIYSASIEAQLPLRLVGSIGYSGQHSDNLLTGSGGQTTVSWGEDVNRFAGDLVINNGTLTRLNHSFGTLNYIYNGAYSNYNGMTVAVRGRFAGHGFVSASYNYSHSADDSQVYPVAFGISQYYGPSVWDTPQRFSLLVDYDIPGITGNAFAKVLTHGWSISGTTNLQSGNPYVVSTSASFQPTRNTAGVITGLSPTSGDYNADGVNLDYPNVNSYSYNTNRQAYLNTGTITVSQFSQSALGTEGNETYGRFRNPGYADTDLGLRKNTTLHDNIALEFRVDAFNAFNRPNLGAVTADLSNASFGKSTSQINSRFLQLGAVVSF